MGWLTPQGWQIRKVGGGGAAARCHLKSLFNPLLSDVAHVLWWGLLDEETIPVQTEPRSRSYLRLGYCGIVGEIWGLFKESSLEMDSFLNSIPRLFSVFLAGSIAVFVLKRDVAVLDCLLSPSGPQTRRLDRRAGTTPQWPQIPQPCYNTAVQNTVWTVPGLGVTQPCYNTAFQNTVWTVPGFLCSTQLLLIGLLRWCRPLVIHDYCWTFKHS